jgi:hypothetical protein
MWQPGTQRLRQWLTSTLVLLLTFGAYIPAGFMPAPGTPFLLELCPAAAPLPASMSMDTAKPMAMSMPMDMPMDMTMPMDMPMDMSKAGHGHPHGDPHQSGSHSHSHFENCPFGSAPGAGPLSQGIVFTPPAPVGASFDLLPEPPRNSTRPPRSHQPRGPPSPA